MGKTFLYFEITDGGMNHHLIYSKEKLKCLHGWMGTDVRREDLGLVDWMGQAEIGDYLHHRLGTIVRVRYVSPNEDVSD